MTRIFVELPLQSERNELKELVTVLEHQLEQAGKED